PTSSSTCKPPIHSPRSSRPPKGGASTSSSTVLRVRGRGRCSSGSRPPSGGTMVIQGEGNAKFPEFPIGRLTRKGMTLKSARGHSYRAVEMGLQLLASGKFPLALLMTHRFGLKEVDYAIKSVGGEGAP